MGCEWDVGESMMTAAITAYSADVTSENMRGSMTSLNNQVQDATFVVLPVLFGVVAARSHAAALLLAALLMLCANATFTTLALSAAREAKK